MKRDGTVGATDVEDRWRNEHKGRGGGRRRVEEQHRHKRGSGRVEEAEGITPEAKGRRVWGGRVKATEGEKRVRRR